MGAPCGHHRGIVRRNTERERGREATLEATARGDGDSVGEQRFERIRRLNALRNL